MWCNNSGVTWWTLLCLLILVSSLLIPSSPSGKFWPRNQREEHRKTTVDGEENYEGTKGRLGAVAASSGHLSSPGVTQIDTSWKTVPQTNGLTAMWWWPWYNLAQECSDNIPCLQITGMCWFLSVPVCMEQGKSMFSSIFIIKVFILRGPYGAPKNLQICRSVYQATKPYHKF